MLFLEQLRLVIGTSSCGVALFCFVADQYVPSHEEMTTDPKQVESAHSWQNSQEEVSLN